MLSVPAACLTAEEFVEHGVDFLVIGTNDLTQYTHAADRELASAEHYYRPASKAMKKLITMVMDVAKVRNVPLPNFGAVCRTFAQYDLVLFCYECGGAPLRQLLAETAPANGEKLKIAIVTGAEGGFAAEEAEMAAKAGAKTVGLGPRILRCETAPLAVLASVMTLTGNLE